MIVCLSENVVKYLLENQGYDVFESIVYQYNRSAIILENNGKDSSSKLTNHINIRNYFVTDRIVKDYLSLECFPTAYMIRDFMTKPTQGVAFKRFQDELMGVTEVQDTDPKKPKRSQRSNNSV